MEGPQRCIRIKQIFAILGIISGVSICISFGYKRNINASLWGFLAALFAAVVLNMHINYRRRSLHIRYSPESLRIVKICGLTISIATITAAIVYFILMAVNHEGYRIDGYAPAGIFALIALKWSVMMFFEGRKYERFLVASTTSDVSPIGNHGPPPPYEAFRP